LLVYDIDKGGFVEEGAGQKNEQTDKCMAGLKKKIKL
jgi:hypothetical protein